MNFNQTIQLTLICIAFCLMPLHAQKSFLDDPNGHDRILFTSYIAMDDHIPYCLNLSESIRKFAGLFNDSQIHVYYAAQMKKIIDNLK